MFGRIPGDLVTGPGCGPRPACHGHAFFLDRLLCRRADRRGWNDTHWTGNTFPFTTKGSGGVFGGQIGYNYQVGQYVIGIEGDLAGSSVKGDNEFVFANLTTKQDYLGSLRGRLGYAFDRFLIYGDGGAAFTNYKFSETLVFPPFFQSLGGGSHVGWTAGLGVEYAFTDHWTAGVEWNYYDFGTRSTLSPPVYNRDTENVVVGKINYKF
ncbi:outer membrane protein [Mesorhizobium sp. WSM3860]|uniref:outer membrane protein n=1 Tax=Mesorhizobium sp. WSM3860 TaxID=2029403 RepID=UPI001FE1165C|nr:outer membrane protein [Mesorhizobium sp. WSM3860]